MKKGNRTRLVVAALVAAALTIAGPPPALAGTTLTRFDQTARWSGSMSSGTVPSADACSDTSCQSYDLDLRLPAGSFERPGGMLVSLRWPDDLFDYGNDLDLYVYGPDGKLAGRSTMFAYSSAEGVWVQNPKNGSYRVVIAPREQLASLPFDVYVDFKRGYEVHTSQTNQTTDPTDSGLTAYTPDIVFLGERPAQPRPLLPDLSPAPADNFHIESTASASFYIAADRGLRHQPSCYPQETTGADADQPGSQETNPLRCLRFDSTLRNLGAGPFEFRAYPGQGDGTNAYQAVYRSDGSYTESKVGKAKFSNAHGHVHFEGLEETGLYTIAADGSPGKLVSKMVDKGRCAVDTGNARFGTRASGPPRYYVFSTCDTDDNQDPKDPVFPGESFFRAGVSPGWEDTYPWYILDQYIDITSVPDGRYLVVEHVNRSRAVAESDPSNNTSMACVEFHGTTVAACPEATRG